jgi:hypothetical protein
MKTTGEAQMNDEKRVKIAYRPRTQFKRFHARKQRWSALVCHRRAGKTVATLNDLVRGAVNECKHGGRIHRTRNRHAPSGIGLAFAHGHDPLLGKVSLHLRQRLRLK